MERMVGDCNRSEGLILEWKMMMMEDYTASNKRVITDGRNGKDLEESSHGLILWYYQGICLEGLRKITKILSQDSWSPGQDSKTGPPYYEGVLTINHNIQYYCFKQNRICNTTAEN
jgi:hypothetical protein